MAAGGVAESCQEGPHLLSHLCMYVGQGQVGCGGGVVACQRFVVRRQSTAIGIKQSNHHPRVGQKQSRAVQLPLTCADLWKDGSGCIVVCSSFVLRVGGGAWGSDLCVQVVSAKLSRRWMCGWWAMHLGRCSLSPGSRVVAGPSRAWQWWHKQWRQGRTSRRCVADAICMRYGLRGLMLVICGPQSEAQGSVGEERGTLGAVGVPVVLQRT